MKIIYTLLLFTLGCAWADTGVTSSNDALWIPAGAVTDGAMQVAKVPVGIRAAADGTFIFVARFTPWLGKNLDSGFDIGFGDIFSELVGIVIRHHP